MSARLPPPPLLFQRRASDEYVSPRPGARERQALALWQGDAEAVARRVGRSLTAYASDRRGTAAALRALNAAWDEEFYRVPAEAPLDAAAADAALGGDQFVFDVQTHYVAQERAASAPAEAVLEFIRDVAPDRWRGLDGAHALSLVEFLRCVYFESETSVAVLTSAPGTGENNILTNAEIAATRELLDRLAGSGRLLHHAIVHPNLPGELEAMESVLARCRPVGWKVYTLYGDWRLDDEAAGLPFLERSQQLGVRIVCAHKGLAGLAPTSSPADIGPAAAAFPDLHFLVYHSGYEVPEGDAEEGPYSEEFRHRGTNRLVASLRDAGLAAGANVYAELGSTWYLLARRPREAAHVLGKLLLAVGEDNILWGTDSVWYGSPQPLIDAFRAFRIPDAYCERWGYPPLTEERKTKILGGNAARVYRVDVEAARARAREDDLGWVRAAIAHARAKGTPRL